MRRITNDSDARFGFRSWRGGGRLVSCCFRVWLLWLNSVSFLHGGVEREPLLQLKVWVCIPKEGAEGWGFGVPFSSEKSEFPITKQFSRKSMIVVPSIIHMAFLPKKRSCPCHSI